MNTEYLAQLKEIELDHLMDAQKSINKAIMFKHTNNQEAMTYFLEAAKARLVMYDEVYNKTQQMIQGMTKADENSAEAILYKVLCKQNMEWAMRMKNMVMSGGTW